MSTLVDLIVVGSGPSAVNAAARAREAGASVLMLDVGHEDEKYGSLVPPESFPALRRTDAAQHRYFLGDRFEGIPLGRVRVGAQLTPPRQFIARDTDRLTPIAGDGFAPTESLALGGLGAGWGASSVQFNDRDLAGVPLRHADLIPHYEAVSARIGICGAEDDLLPFYGRCTSLQPPLIMDEGVRLMLSKYEARRERFHRAGFHMGRPRLAVLTKDRDGRRAQQYADMDFYSDRDRSVWRPRFLVEKLQEDPGFTYERPWLVERFCEEDSGRRVAVFARDPATGRQETFHGKRLVIGAGAMGTARIVLRSMSAYGVKTPIVCNPHVYVPCLNLSMLGKSLPERRHSLTQAGIIFDPCDGGDVLYVEAHSYRSLLLYKLAKESFLPLAEAVRVLRGLVGAIVILVIEHEDRPSPAKWCALRRGDAGAPDVLDISYRMEASATHRQLLAEKRLLRCMRSLGCLPLPRLDAGPGSSIHYGGTIPMSAADTPLTVTPSGMLRGTRSVFLADGSVLPHLPAKPLTLTLMALGDRAAAMALKDLA